MTNTPASILCPHFHLNDMELFSDLWEDRWASFRFSIFKGSSPPSLRVIFNRPFVFPHGETYKLVLYVCTELTASGGFRGSAGEKKGGRVNT